MLNIYIIFSYTGTYFSRFLRLMTGEKYVHVSVSLDDKLKKVYSFGRKNPRWMFPTGFIMENMDLISSFFKNARFQIFELQITKAEYRRLRHELKKYLDHQNEFHYNVKGLVHIKFNRIYHRNHHFLCTQFVGKLLQDSKIYDFGKDYSLLRPKDFTKILNMRMIYEGKILDYLEALSNEK